MKRLKKVILSLLFILTLGMISGCGSSKNSLSLWMNEKDKLKVLSTTAQVGSLVEEIGRGRVNCWILIQGELDPHSYGIVKGDAEKFGAADLIFYNGLGLEHGASLASLLNNSSNAVAIGDAIGEKHPDRILKRAGVTDPHIWMDISLWKEGIEPIVNALTELDPDGASHYRENGRELALKMQTTHLEIQEILQKVPSNKRYLVTSHDAFNYFTRCYLANPGETSWADRFAAPEGLAPEGQLNLRDIQKIIEFLKVKNINVIFPESNVSRDSIRKIATAGKELGLDICICSEPIYGDAMSNLTYLEMMQSNANTISKYLWNMQ